MATYTSAQLFAVVATLCSVFFACQADNQPFVLSNIKGEQYQQMIDSGEHFLVNFGTTGCIRCKELEPDYQEVFNHYRGNPALGVFKMNDINIVRKLGLQKVPTIMLFRHGVPILYEGEMTSEDIIHWTDENLESFTVHLKDEDFEHLTQSSTGSTTGDWLVKFCSSDVMSCTSLQPVWESTAYKLKGRVNVASVNVTENPKLVRRFKIQKGALPVIIFFRQSKQYLYMISQKNSAAFVTFAESGFIHAKGVDVMPPPSPFDELTETIALKIKSLTSGDNASTVLLIGGVAFGVIILVIVLCFCKSGSSGGFIQDGKTKKSV